MIKDRKIVEKFKNFVKLSNLSDYSKALEDLDLVIEVDKDGNKFWRNKKDQLHRLGGPAIEWASGDKEWWINNKKHKEDGPAVIWADGTKMWYINDKLHRTNGPAIEWANGTKEWYINDQKQCFNGPAVIHPNGSKEWWISDKKCSSEEEWKQYVNLLKTILNN